MALVSLSYCSWYAKLLVIYFSVSGGHMGLIIDLSQQLSSQEAELSKARETLKRLGADKC